MIRLSQAEREARDNYRKAVRERKKASSRQKVEKAVKLGGEPVEIGKRPKLTDAQKRQSHKDHGGLCYICKAPVPMFGPEVQYDHKRERWENGPDTLGNIGPAHTVPCHAEKTARKTAERAHVDAMGRKHRGEKKPKGRKIQSRGFDDDYQPIGTGRGFPTSRPQPSEDR